MAGNAFGYLFRLTTFGESHGYAIGGVIDGCPAGVVIDFEALQYELSRRKPGQSSITTQRKESDEVQILSGVYKNKTTGAPIGFIILNADQNSKDYDHLEDVYRPSHADYTYDAKYGHRDHRGGGRSSARETACRVVAGAIAKQILKRLGIQVYSFVSAVGDVKVSPDFKVADVSEIDKSIVRCPSFDTADEMIKLIGSVRDKGDTIGGVVSGVVTGVPAGLGEPVFNRLHADLGKAMLSINAVKGFEYGSGFDGTTMLGSQHNDVPDEKGQITNNAGGILGGISNGQDIEFRVGFKPVATLIQDQEGLDKKGKVVVIKGRGRHDPCVVPRAVPIVDAMAAMVILDHYLLNKSVKLNG